MADDGRERVAVLVGQPLTGMLVCIQGWVWYTMPRWDDGWMWWMSRGAGYSLLCGVGVSGTSVARVVLLERLVGRVFEFGLIVSTCLGARVKT